MPDAPDTKKLEEKAEAEPEPSAVEKREARLKLARDEGIQAMEGIDELREKGTAASSLLAFSPASFADAMELASVVCNSGIVAEGLAGKPGATITVMARGATLGIPWPTAVTVGHVVHGRVGWPAEVLHAVVERAPEVEYFEVKYADNEKATVIAKAERWKEEREHTVTMDDAKAMGFLDGKHSKLWMGARPRPMLIAFARREAAREWFPALTLGLVTVDELEDEGAGEKNVTPAATATAQLEAFAGADKPTQEPQEASDEPENGKPAPEVAVPTSDPVAPSGDQAVTTGSPTGDQTDGGELTDEEKAAIEARESAEAAAQEKPKLDEAGLKRIKELRKAIPVVGLDRLEHAVGGHLDQLQGKAGETSAELEQRVLKVLEECKKQVVAQG